MGVNIRTTFLFWNIHTRLIHDNTSTPPLLIWLQLKHMHQGSTDALLCLVVLGSLSADEQISQISPEFGIRDWSALVDSNRKPKTSLYRSSHQRCSMKKGVLRNFTKFTGKHLCQSLFFNKESLFQLTLSFHVYINYDENLWGMKYCRK